MDPLSFTASIITVLGVGGQVANTIKRLASLKDASDVVLALNNEISDLRLTVMAIRYEFERQETSEITADASITSSLEQANEKVHELETLQNRLAKVVPEANGTTVKKRVTWLREQKTIQRLQHDLRGIRLQLVIALSILNLYVSILTPAFCSLLVFLSLINSNIVIIHS